MRRRLDPGLGGISLNKENRRWGSQRMLDKLSQGTVLELDGFESIQQGSSWGLAVDKREKRYEICTSMKKARQ